MKWHLPRAKVIVVASGGVVAAACVMAAAPESGSAAPHGGAAALRSASTMVTQGRESSNRGRGVSWQGANGPSQGGGESKHGRGWPGGLSVDWGLSGEASASSAGTNEPASNAIDGDAGTDWCPDSWEGTLTVDLGSVRSLDGLGVTLDSASPSADASISLAAKAGDWQTVPSAGNIALDPGNPMYVPLPRGQAARYAQLTVKSGTGAPVCVGEFRMFGPDPAASDMDLGGDLSFTPQELAAGAHFTYRGTVQNPISIMRENGANYARLRLWMYPPPGYNNLASDLAMAKAIESSGMKLYLDIMYSNFWADPTKQITPPMWRGEDLTQLAQSVRAYTNKVISAFAAQGTPVDMVSIGNEIRNGILWPVGRVNWTKGTGWDNLATLLKAGVAGAKAGNPPGHPLDIMMHFDQGGNNTLSDEFYGKLVSLGVPFNVIGLSYYPFFHGPISAMRQNVDALATQFHKKIVIAETQYPWTLANGDSLGNFVWQTSQLSPGYPASPGGQLSFVSDELSILAQVPDHLGAGLFYWAPEWIPGVGWKPGAGTPNDNLTLFNFQGTALPSIGILTSPPQVCASYDPWDVPCVISG